MYRTLIVDDEQSVHQAIRALVDWNALGVQPPGSAYHGAEALEIMETGRPQIVFIDMNMPKMNGVDFLEQASSRYPGSRFIVVSGYDSFDFARAALRHNVVDYLLKPIDEEELAAALKKAVSLLPPQPEEAQTADDIADDLKKYIDEHYREEISLDFLAERFHFSREYIGRIFRSRHGYAVYEYILQVRMKQAVELLRNPKLTLPVIADFLGYSNANYFSKAFRRFYGISPIDFRNQHFRQETSSAL